MIIEITRDKEKEWDDFVQSHKCSYYFKIAWRDVVYINFKHQYQYYISTNNSGEIDGILPLFVIKSFLGVKLISIPYCPYGGVVANNDNIKNLLINKAIDLGRSFNAKYVEIKNVNELYKNFIIYSNYYTFQLNLDIPINDIRTSLSKSNKRKLNKSKNLNTKVTIDSNIEVFYKLYLKHLKNKGTPAIKYKFFKDIIENDKENVKVATIWYKGEVASSILLLETPYRVIYDRGAINEKLRDLNLNYTLFWEVIKYYSELDVKYFDFGRSIKESGTFQFKRSWRPNLIKLNYQYYLFRGVIPEYSQSGRKRKILTKILKVFPRIEYVDNYLRKLFP